MSCLGQSYSLLCYKSGIIRLLNKTLQRTSHVIGYWPHSILVGTLVAAGQRIIKGFVTSFSSHTTGAPNGDLCRELKHMNDCNSDFPIISKLFDTVFSHGVNTYTWTKLRQSLLFLCFGSFIFLVTLR